MELKKALVWFVKIILPIIAVMLTLWSLFFRGETRELSYEIVSKAELGSMKAAGWPDIEIFYKNNKIAKGGILTVRIKNSGNAPISAKEYEGPINAQLGGESKFLSARVIETHPKNLTTAVTISKNVLSIAPLLLNPNDDILFQALIEGDIDNVAMAARIGGVEEMKNIGTTREQAYRKFTWIYFAYGLFCLMGYWLVLDKVIYNKDQDTDPPTISKSGAILIAILLMLAGQRALYYFSETQGMDNGFLSSLFIFIGLALLAGLLAIPFKVKK